MSITYLTVRRRTAARTALVLAMIALAGCGSSSPSSSTKAASSAGTSTTTTATPAALTHEEFVAKLDNICKRGNRAAIHWAAHFRPAVGANFYANTASLVEQFARTWVPYRAEMSKLRPPAADEPAYARFMAANNRLDGLTIRLIAALKAKDKAEIKRLSDLADTERDARTEAAIDGGTRYCGA